MSKFNREKKDKKPGYVIILALVIIGSAFALITAVLNQSFGFSRMSNIFKQKEIARTLALSAIDIGISQVSFIDKSQEDTPSDKKDLGVITGEKEKKSPESEWLKQLLKVLNKWQDFKLTYEQDGIDAQISIYITSEQGKISLNYLDKVLVNKAKSKTEEKSAEQKGQVSQAPNGAGQNILKQPEQSDKTQPFEKVIDELVKKETDVSILSVLSDLRSNLGRVVDDPSELLLSSQIRSKIVAQGSKLKIYPDKDKNVVASLFGLFTVWSNSGTVNPWLLSEATAKTLGLTQKPQVDIDKITKNFKPSNVWSQDWDSTLGELYGKKFSEFSKGVQQLFAMQFDATAFGIAIEVKYENIVQRLYAIVQKQKRLDPKDKSKIFNINRLYWL